jgi:hypothetical protein
MKRRRASAAEALGEIRRWAGRAAPPDWTEEEWRSLMVRAVAQAPDAGQSRRLPLWRPALAGAAMLAALVTGAWFLTSGQPRRPSVAGITGTGPDSRAGEMLPADPAKLVAPRTMSREPSDAGNPFLSRPPALPPAWILIRPGAGSTVLLFVRPPAWPPVSR